MSIISGLVPVGCLVPWVLLSRAHSFYVVWIWTTSWADGKQVMRIHVFFIQPATMLFNLDPKHWLALWRCGSECQLHFQRLGLASWCAWLPEANTVCWKSLSSVVQLAKLPLSWVRAWLRDNSGDGACKRKPLSLPCLLLQSFSYTHSSRSLLFSSFDLKSRCVHHLASHTLLVSGVL